MTNNTITQSLIFGGETYVASGSYKVNRIYADVQAADVTVISQGRSVTCFFSFYSGKEFQKPMDFSIMTDEYYNPTAGTRLTEFHIWTKVSNAASAASAAIEHSVGQNVASFPIRISDYIKLEQLQ